MLKDGENRISVEFRDGVCEKWPVFNRKYTVTHSDETAEIFVTIGMEYARDKYSAMRDEVILHFLCCNNCIKMMGYVQIDVPGRYFDREKRKTIFCREMPKALQAVRYADRIFFDAHEELDQASVWIQFVSDDFAYSKASCFGKMKDYCC